MCQLNTVEYFNYKYVCSVNTIPDRKFDYVNCLLQLSTFTKIFESFLLQYRKEKYFVDTVVDPVAG